MKFKEAMPHIWKTFSPVLMQVKEPEVQVSPVPRGHARPQYIPLSPQVPDTEAVVLYPEGYEDRVSLAGRSVRMSSSITHSTNM